MPSETPQFILFTVGGLELLRVVMGNLHKPFLLQHSPSTPPHPCTLPLQAAR